MKFPTSSAIVLAAFVVAIAPIKADPSPRKTTNLTEREREVLEGVNAGERVRLSQDDTLSASFLESLLTGTLPSLKLHRNGVRIEGAVFKQSIDLANARILCNFEMNGCDFKQDVTLENAILAGTVSFEGSTFRRAVNFIGLKAERGPANFGNVIFEGLVDFGGAEFGGTLNMKKAEFRNASGPRFNPLKVNGRVWFENAIFKGPPDFFAEIGGNFDADGAEFQNTTGLVWLDINCAGRGYFQKTKFSGPVSFADSTYINLYINRVNLDGATVPSLDISRIRVKGLFQLLNTKIENLIAGSLRIEGPAELTGLQVTGKADFSYAHFDILVLSNSTWPVANGAFKLQGVKYESISAASSNEGESHKRLLDLAVQAAYSADVYKNLENFFLSQGYRDDADRVFIAGKRRERGEYLDGFAWLGSWMLDCLVGYGRHPWRAGIPCASFVILGCFLFWPSKMELQKKEDSTRVYNPFWYSLSLFVPFVDLQSHTVWKPKDGCWFLRHYMRMHTLLGWILIPILLAAISGLIK